MDAPNPLDRLAAWYASQCDGSWEHHNGISIATSDNPAWNVRISLVGTSAEGTHIPTFESPDYLDNSSDWVRCWLSDKGDEYFGVGDPSKLPFIVDYFLSHVS